MEALYLALMLDSRSNTHCAAPLLAPVFVLLRPRSHVMIIRDFTMTGFEFVSKKRPCCRFLLEPKDPENKLTMRVAVTLCLITSVSAFAPLVPNTSTRSVPCEAGRRWLDFGYLKFQSVSWRFGMVAHMACCVRTSPQTAIVAAATSGRKLRRKEVFQAQDCGQCEYQYDLLLLAAGSSYQGVQEPGRCWSPSIAGILGEDVSKQTTAPKHN
jgi:hypothetical protein